MMFRDTDEEEMTEDEAQDMIDTIVERVLTEEQDQEENALKIEIVENPPCTSNENQESKYTQVGLEKDPKDQDEFSVKAFKVAKGDRQLEEKPPPWRTSRDAVHQASPWANLVHKLSSTT